MAPSPQDLFHSLLDEVFPSRCDGPESAEQVLSHGITSSLPTDVSSFVGCPAAGVSGISLNDLEPSIPLSMGKTDPLLPDSTPPPAFLQVFGSQPGSPQDGPLRDLLISLGADRATPPSSPSLPEDSLMEEEEEAVAEVQWSPRETIFEPLSWSNPQEPAFIPAQPAVDPQGPASNTRLSFTPPLDTQLGSSPQPMGFFNGSQIYVQVITSGVRDLVAMATELAQDGDCVVVLEPQSSCSLLVTEQPEEGVARELREEENGGSCLWRSWCPKSS